MFSFLHKITPRSLFARFLLIIIIPTVLTQAVAITIFYQRHWENVSNHMARSLAGELAVIVKTRDNLNEEDYKQFLKHAEKDLDLKIKFYLDKKIKKSKLEDEELEIFQTELENRIKNDFSIIYSQDKSDIRISIKLKDNSIIEVTTSKKRLANPTTYIFILWMTGTNIILLLLAILFSRTQIRSITRLADAAEKFGKGQQIDYFKPEGAREVRKAARAFLKMKERIERQISQRTQMLAGVSHDLRTPLTRMKLQLAMLETTTEISELQNDIIEMEKMINGYLNFARSGDLEPSEEVDLVALSKELVKNYSHAIEIQFNSSNEKLLIPLKKLSFKRALVNLLDNTVKYAEKANFTIVKRSREVQIIIEDNGEGIEQNKREEVFKPFYRVENEKNKQTSGVGLGLAITKDIILLHGGNIYLTKSNLGGLKVNITLPL